jgi:tryptophan-rich sensory protein
MTLQQQPISRSRDYGVLILFLVVCFAVSGISGIVTADSVGGWYAGLNKPSFNPPNWIFAPVWTALYAMMAIAAWRVWRVAGLENAVGALTLFGVQLLLNFLWSMIFFGAHSLGYALAEIVILLVAIVATLLAFWRHDRIAGWLFVPYAAWVSFATVLNAAIWRLN